MENFLKKDVNIVASPTEDKMPSLIGVLLSWFPMLLLIGVWIFSCVKCKVEEAAQWVLEDQKPNYLTEAQGKVTFNDVAGIEEAKEEVEEIVEFLKDPKNLEDLVEKYQKEHCLLVLQEQEKHFSKSNRW